MSYDYDEFDANNFDEDYNDAGFEASYVSRKSKEKSREIENILYEKNNTKSNENDKKELELDNKGNLYNVYKIGHNGMEGEEIDDEIDEEIMEYKNDEEDEDEEEVIIMDEDQKFSDEDIIEHAKFLGFDTENDLDLLYIAKKALFTPLPKNWNRCFLKRNNRICYLNMETQSFNQYSPNDEVAISEYTKARKEKENQIRQKEDINNNKKTNMNNSQNNYNYSPISQKLTDSVNINNDIKNFLETDQDKKPENTEENEDEIESIKSEVLEENLLVDTIREDQNHIEKENKSKPSPYLALIKKNNSNKTQKLEQDDKEIKETILKEKFAELQSYSIDLRKEYERKRLNYKDEKNNLIKKMELEYEQKTKLELENLVKNSKKLLEDNTIIEEKNNFERDLDSHRKQCENELLRNQQCDLDKFEQKLENLLKEKSNLNQEIEMINKIHSTTTSMNEFNVASLETLQQARDLLEEKFNLDLKMIERKFLVLEREMELAEEDKFLTEKEKINDENKVSLEMREKSMKSIFSSMFEDYQKMLEEEYSFNTKSIVHLCETSLRTDLKSIKENLENEIKEKQKYYQEANSLVEQLYYNDLLKAKEEFKTQINIKDEYVLNSFYNRIINDYTKFSKILNEKLEEEIHKLLQTLITNNNLESDELVNLLETSLFENNLIIHKNKLIYQNKVKEFKISFKTLDYYITLGKELLKIIKQKFNKILLNDPLIKESIYEELSYQIKDYCEQIKDNLEKNDDFTDVLIYNFDIFCREIEQSPIENGNNNNMSMRQSHMNGFISTNNNQIINEFPTNDLTNSPTNYNNITDDLLNKKLEKLDIGLYQNYLTIQQFVESEIKNLNQSKCTLDSLKKKNDNLLGVLKRNNNLDKNSNYFKILKEDHLKYSKEYSKLDNQINEFMNIEQSFKETISFIASNTKIDKNIIISKFSNLNSMIQNYKSNLSQNTTTESEPKPLVDLEEKTFTTQFSSKKLWNPSDHEKRSSGNIYSNLLSLSLKKSSINNHFINSYQKNANYNLK